MNPKFVSFHTMTRGAGKPTYVVKCAQALAEKTKNVLVLDGVMYEQGAIPLLFHQLLGSYPRFEEGRNLYDLIQDYEILCSAQGGPPLDRDPKIVQQLSHPLTKFHRGRLYPDLLDRISPIPGLPFISFLPGNNGKVVEVRQRIDFEHLYQSCDGEKLFAYLKETLSPRYDLVLINAPAGHQEISGIFCGQVADLILAIDVDSPIMEADASFMACSQLAKRVYAENGRQILVRSVKGHAVSDVVDMILQNNLG